MPGNTLLFVGDYSPLEVNPGVTTALVKKQGRSLEGQYGYLTGTR